MGVHLHQWAHHGVSLVVLQWIASLAGSWTATGLHLHEAGQGTVREILAPVDPHLLGTMDGLPTTISAGTDSTTLRTILGTVASLTGLLRLNGPPVTMHEIEVTRGDHCRLLRARHRQALVADGLIVT